MTELTARAVRRPGANMAGARRRSAALLLVIFAAYSALMIWELFWGPYRVTPPPGSANLIPFSTILPQLLGYRELGLHLWVINLIGNVGAFVPLGFFLAYFVPRLRRMASLVTVAVVIVLTAELLQLGTNVGIFDIDDVILNAFGCYLGYLVFRRLDGRRLPSFDPPFTR